MHVQNVEIDTLAPNMWLQVGAPGCSLKNMWHVNCFLFPWLFVDNDPKTQSQ